VEDSQGGSSASGRALAEVLGQATACPYLEGGPSIQAARAPIGAPGIVPVSCQSRFAQQPRHRTPVAGERAASPGGPRQSHTARIGEGRRWGDGAHVPSVRPSSGEGGGTRGNGVGRGGMTNPRRIKAIAGNSASCLGFSIALLTGSIPAASMQSNKEPKTCSD